MLLLPPARATSEKVLPPALPNRTWFSALKLPTTMSMNPSPSTSATEVDEVLYLFTICISCIKYGRILSPVYKMKESLMEFHLIKLFKRGIEV